MSDPMEVAGSAGALAPGEALSKMVAAMDKSMGTEAMEKATRSADQLVASAKLNGFKVTPEAADPIIKVLEDFIERIERMRFNMRIFEQAPPLGNHDYGKKVAQHMQKAATDERSARSAVLSLKVVLEKSREALLRASNQYEDQEESALDAFRGMGG